MFKFFSFFMCLMLFFSFSFSMNREIKLKRVKNSENIFEIDRGGNSEINEVSIDNYNAETHCFKSFCSLFKDALECFGPIWRY